MIPLQFQFPASAELIAMAQNAKRNHEHQRTCYTNRRMAEPALLLVKDQGVYLISPFKTKGAEKNARLYDEKGQLVVCYATGYKPSEAYVGGDDFGVDLPGLPDQIVNEVATNPNMNWYVNITLYTKRVLYNIRRR